MLANIYIDIIKPIIKFQNSLMIEYTLREIATRMPFSCGTNLESTNSSKSVEYSLINPITVSAISGLSSSSFDAHKLIVLR